MVSSFLKYSLHHEDLQGKIQKQESRGGWAFLKSYFNFVLTEAVHHEFLQRSA